MNRRLLLMALAAVPVALAADALPSAESVLDRFVEATGGKAAYEKRKSEIATGTLEYKAQGIKGTITRYESQPDNYYAALDIPGVGKIEMGVRGGVAWENSALLGPRVKDGEERRQAIREGTMNATMLWKQLFPKVENAGLETVNGEECYKIVMTPTEGTPETNYFSKKSGLALRTTTIAASQMGDVPVEVNVANYKDFGGILAPATVTTKTAGQEFSISMEKVQVNPEIPADRFAIPAEVQAIIEKRKATGK